MKLIAVLLLCVFVNPAFASANSAPHADYAWTPDYKKLFLRGGIDLYSTASNYDNTGTQTNLASSAELSRTMFWVQPEYGIAQDWALRLKLGFISSSVTTGSGTPVLSSSGFNDMEASVKWMVRPFDPLLTLEPFFIMPTAESIAPSAKDVALGDGAFGAGLRFNTLHESGPFAVGFSPGVLYRNRGYSLLFTGDVFAQFDFRRGYIRGYGNFTFPIQVTKLYDSSISKHDVAGSAGSYALLSGSPMGMYAGGKLGIKLVGELFVETWFQRAMFGQRYASFNQFGFGLFYAFDFLDTLPVKQVREVPFDSDQSEFYKGK